MITRLISANSSELLKMNGDELKQSIKASEGRTVLSENVVIQPAIDGLTMSEIAAAFGADLILLNLFDVFEPKVSGLEVKDAKGTVPGFTSDELIKIVKIVHQHDGLVMSTIGTSQESSGKDVIREIALKNKTCGVDIQHIGDAAWGVLSPTETIFELSKTIRGLNHTISRMARSINR